MPQAAAPLAGRGRVHLAVGRPHAAIRDFTRAANVDPRFAAAYRSRAEAKLEIGHHQDAIEDLSRAIAFDVGNVELYVLRGRAYLATDNIEAALKDFSHVIELDPKLGARLRRARPRLRHREDATRRRSPISTAPSSSTRAPAPPSPIAPWSTS